MNSEQIANLSTTPNVIVNENQGSAARSNGRATNRNGDDCCVNGVGSKAQELLDRVPPCTGSKNYMQYIMNIIKNLNKNNNTKT